MYGRSLSRSGQLLAGAGAAARLDQAPPTIAGDWSFDEKDFHIEWFADGVLNVSANCLDRHLAEARRPDRDDLGARRSRAEEPRRFTYRELHAEVCRFANVLKAQGVDEGRPRHHLHADDPRGGVRDARLRADRRDPFGGVRRLLARGAGRAHHRLRLAASSSPPTKAGAAARRVPLKANVDAAAAHAPALEKVIVVKATGGDVAMQPGRDVWYHEAAATVSADCPPEPMGAEDPLFILYTSGSTGKPKGVLHTIGRLSALGEPDPRTGVRLPPGRDLLVRRRYRLGHRAQLYRLWPARQRRDDADVRRACPTGPTPAASGRSSTGTRSRSSTPRRPRCAR